MKRKPRVDLESPSLIEEMLSEAEDGVKDLYLLGVATRSEQDDSSLLMGISLAIRLLKASGEKRAASALSGLAENKYKRWLATRAKRRSLVAAKTKHNEKAEE